MSCVNRVLFTVGLTLFLAGLLEEAVLGGTFTCRQLGIAACANLGETQCKADEGCDEDCFNCFGSQALPGTVCVYDPDGQGCSSTAGPYACGTQQRGECDDDPCGCHSTIDWGVCSAVQECAL